MKTKVVLIFLFASQFLSLSGQSSDSLRNIFFKLNNKQDKAQIAYQLGGVYLNNFDLDTAKHYFSYAVENFKSDRKLSDAHQNVGIVNFYQNDFTNALDNFQLSLVYAQKIGNDSIIARRYSDIGVIYEYLGAYQKAVEYYFLALEIFEKRDDKPAIAKIYNNLGIVEQGRNKFEKSLEYYQKALEIKKEYNALDVEIASTFVNIGTVYEDLKQYSKALAYYQNALPIFQKNNIDKYSALCFSNIAGIHFYKNNIDSAIIFNEKSLKLNQKINNNLGLVSSYFLRGKIYNKKQKTDSSIYFLKLADNIADSLMFLDKRRDILIDLVEILENEKFYSDAFLFQKELLTIKDTLNNENLNDKIETLNIVYETEKKEEEIVNLQKIVNKNRLLLIAIAFILSLILIIGYLIFRHKLTESRYKADLFNQKLLRLQMNPHFIFNALTSIQSYMLDKDSKKAAIYLSSFSKLTRSILNNSRQEIISLEEEIETIENYLKIQQMRHENCFSYEVIVDEELDTEIIQIPPMLSQPFVENSIVHGVKDIDYKGEIIVEFKKNEDFMQISVEDNGKGIEKNIQKTHKSHATDITKERLKIINKNKKKIISFEIINLKDVSEMSGTKVVFNLPLIEKQ